MPGVNKPAGQGGIELGSARAAYGAPPPPAKPMQPEAAMQALNETLLDILPDAPEEARAEQEPPAVHYPASAAAELASLPDAEGRTLLGAVTDALVGMQAASVVPAAKAGDDLTDAPHRTDGEQEEAARISLSALPSEELAPEQIAMEPAAPKPLRLVGEVFKTYIITERGGELCLIDKHAAHERILFEKLAQDYGHVPAQMLLVPVQVNLTAAEKQALLQNLELLADAGLEAEDFGGATVIVRAVPADVPVDDVEDMVVELAAHLAEGGRSALREKTEWVLHSIACRAAIKAGDRTTEAEMLALAQKIMDGTVPPFCPHGRPCVLKITRKELEKQFGRLV